VGLAILSGLPLCIFILVCLAGYAKEGYVYVIDYIFLALVVTSMVVNVILSCQFLIYFQIAINKSRDNEDFDILVYNRHWAYHVENKKAPIGNWITGKAYREILLSLKK
jgi:hypothetical protein